MKKLDILFKKEIKDFVYSSKCWILFFFVILGEKVIIKRNHDAYNIYFHFWWITFTVQQFIYDSFLTDVREKGTLFLCNAKIKFLNYYLVKCLFCAAIMILMLSGEIHRIVKISNALQVLFLFSLSMMVVPVEYFMLILAKGNEAVGIILSNLIMGALFLLLTKLPASVLTVLLGVAINVLFYVAVNMAQKSLYFRKLI
ncbi:MAG: hypothetical protein GX297_05045 [Treponema sp.]|nr:hypothetical protein [Treponema sp.]